MKSVIYLMLSLGTLLSLNPVVSLSTTRERESRKFGGYRIAPKFCNATRLAPGAERPRGPTICMFNHECSQRNGEVVGACMDGFLFGTCCLLKAEDSGNSSADGSNSEDYIEEMPVSNLAAVSSYERYGSSQADPFDNKKDKYDDDFVMDSDMAEKYIKLNEATSYSYSTIPPEDEKTTTTSTTEDVSDSDETMPTTNMYLPNLSSQTYSEELPSSIGTQDNIDSSAPSLEEDAVASSGLQYIGNTLLREGVDSTTNRDVFDATTENEGEEEDDTSYPTTAFVNRRPLVTTTTERSTKITYAKPQFRPRPTKNSNPNSNFVLVQTISNENLTEGNNNKNEVSENNLESIESIILMLNDSKPGPSYDTDLATERIGNTDTTFSTYPAYDTTYQTNRYRPVTRKPTRPAFTTSARPAEPSYYSVYSTRKPNIEAILTQSTLGSTYSYNDHTPTSIYYPSSNYVSVGSSSSKRPKPSTQQAPTVEIIKTTVGSKRPTASPSSTTVKVNRVKVTAASAKPSTLKVTTPKPTSSRPVSSSLASTITRRPATATSFRVTIASTKSPTTITSVKTTKATKKPPSTSYVYSSTPTRRPVSSKPTKTAVSQSPILTASDFPNPTSQRLPPEYIIQSHQVTDVRPDYGYGDATYGVVTSERPSPTVHITPKPTVNLVTSSNYGQQNNNNNNVGSSNTKLPQGISVIYNQSPAILIPAPADFENEGYFGISTTIRPGVEHTVTQTSIYSIVPSSQKLPIIHTFTPSPLQNGASTLSVPIKISTHSATDDMINFPPVRNPNLNITGSRPGTATVVELDDEDYDNEIRDTTPSFVEDEVLHNKMDLLVSKIVASLQDNFEGLGKLVQQRKNVTILKDSPDAATKRPTTKKPITTTKRSTTATKRPANAKPQKPQSDAPARPTTTKRPLKATTKKPIGTSKKPVTTKTTRRTTTTPPSNDDDAEYESESTEAEEENEVETEEEPLPSFGNAKIQCGVRPQIKSGRIVGGKAAQFGEWPWQVLVKESTWLGLFTKNKCGGVLISNNYVMTAAHCQPGFLASLVAVLGEHDISGELEVKRSVTKNVKQIIVHRGYDPATFENDLALLQLESPVHYDTHIVPICLPPDNADFTGRKATITGWGRLKYNGGVPSVLQEVQVPVMENSVCQEMFNTAGHTKKILPSFLCAGFANGQRDSCEGDSGGPLVLQRYDGRFELVGTVSHGIKCASPFLPGVYMRTTYYKPWIKSVTNIK